MGLEMTGNDAALPGLVYNNTRNNPQLRVFHFLFLPVIYNVAWGEGVKRSAEDGARENDRNP